MSLEQKHDVTLPSRTFWEQFELKANFSCMLRATLSFELNKNPSSKNPQNFQNYVAKYGPQHRPVPKEKMSWGKNRG